MKIRIATNDDILQLKELWHLSFGDDKNYIDFYFSRRFDANYTVVMEENKKVIGMIHLLPCSIKDKGKAFYWYAVCIHPEHRNKGYFRSILTTTLKETQKKGYINICLPAKGLGVTYQKYGFHFPYYATKTTFSGGVDSPFVAITTATVDDFLSIDQKEGSVVWSRSDISYAIEENDYCGGKTIKFHYQGKDYVALAVKKDDCYFLDSTNLDVETVKIFQNSLLTDLKTRKIILRSFKASVDDGSIFGLCDTDCIGAGATINFTLS